MMITLVKHIMENINLTSKFKQKHKIVKEEEIAYNTK
jgi:hypothetical protein